MQTFTEQDRPLTSGSDKSLDSTLFPILQNNKIGYINRAGQLVIAPQFTKDEATNFRVLSAVTARGSAEGLIPVKTTGSWAYMDNYGTLITKPDFENAGTFHQGVAPVMIGGKWGYIDTAGKIKI